MREAEKDRAKGGKQFEIGFMDLSQFDELERRVHSVIQRLRALEAENTELRNRIAALEAEVAEKEVETEQLLSLREQVKKSSGIAERDALLRRKVQDLLKKLEAFQPSA